MTVVRIELEPFNPRSQREVVEWDREAGTLTGRLADKLRQFLIPGGLLPTNPPPGGYRMPADPIRDPATIAALLGDSYRLPDWLAQHYPHTPDDGEPSDVEPIY